jgi:hypothetical protein
MNGNQKNNFAALANGKQEHAVVILYFDEGGTQSFSGVREPTELRLRG